MTDLTLSAEQIRQFDEAGYLILLSRQHLACLSAKPQLAAALVAHLRVRGCRQYVRPI